MGSKTDVTDAAAIAAAEEKKRRKAEKKAAKRKAAEEATISDEQPEQHQPASKKAKKDDVDATAADSTDADKEEKRKRKEEKKQRKKEAKKAAAAVASADQGAASNGHAAAATSSSSTLVKTDAAAARAFMESNNITLEAPEESTERPPMPMLSFAELEGRVDARLKKELDRNGFERPTPIQACCWSVLLAGSDVVGIAETGSGKTFAFGLPGVDHILKSPLAAECAKRAGVAADGAKSSSKKGKGASPSQPAVSVLVIAPTRELAIQTHEHMAKLAKAAGIGSVCLYGGVSKHEQIKLLNASPSIRIVVGTPGRVLDLAREGSLDLSGVSYLVLDEADRMLDVGFEPDIRAIVGMIRSRDEGRHTSMFSATWPPAVRGLAESFMNAPIRVTVGSDELSANHRVEQLVEVLQDGRAKERRLDAFLKKIGAGPKGKNARDKVLIFALYKKEAQRVEDTLRRNGYKVAGIHGDLNQHQRMASLESFKKGETPLLVATDVAARGIDVPSVEYVINYTFPLTIEDYVHRIGRTGRGGKSGKSLTFFTDEDKAHAGSLIRVLKDANQPVPEAMNAFPTTIKKKEHSSYGSHFRDLVPGKAKKITFD